MAMFGFFVNDQLGGYTELFHSCSCPLRLIKLRSVPVTEARSLDPLRWVHRCNLRNSFVLAVDATAESYGGEKRRC